MVSELHMVEEGEKRRGRGREIGRGEEREGEMDTVIVSAIEVNREEDFEELRKGPSAFVRQLSSDHFEWLLSQLIAKSPLLIEKRRKR